MPEFPKYVGIFNSNTQNWSSALSLNNVKDGVAQYDRPANTGGWCLNATWINGELIVADCLGGHLIGRTLISITEQEFRNDNRR
ncbi:MAG: hypothetical protein HDS67_00100 [Bacteroidales bacterium]|nr:hypothetical protein [Bacteroidales bacterium]